MKNARLLRTTRYSIDRDYPPEIVAARMKLWPELKRLRQVPYTAVKMFFPAAISVNGEVKIDEFSHWDSMVKSAKFYKPNYIYGPPIAQNQDSNKQQVSEGTEDVQN